MALQFESLKAIEGAPAKLAVVGAGAFGSALAACAVTGGCAVTLFGRDRAALAEVAKDPLAANLELVAMDAFEGDLSSFHLILLAVPAQALREVTRWLNARLPGPSAPPGKGNEAPPVHVLSAAKGIEQKTLLLPHQILVQGLPKGTLVGTLSGPSFARELRQGLPTAVVVASASDALKRRVELLLHRDFFRVYGSHDVVGVEVGGALKNVIAMVAGAVDGLKLGNNARAAVVTRGLGEIAQVGVRLGADPMTFLGLSGLGDLILTCTGELSRNRTFGLRLAAGERPEAVASALGQVVEGYATAQSAHELSRKLGLDTPILKTAYTVLYEGLPIKEAVFNLVRRERKGEFDWIKK